MFRIVLLLLLLLHGLIHLLGFVKAFRLAPVEQLSGAIGKPVGLAWLLATVLFLVTTLVFLLGKDWWWLPALFAVVLSQVLIFTVWQDARFGTVANVVILLAVVVGFGSWRFERVYEKDVAEGLRRMSEQTADLLTEEDLQPLPPPVQQYLRYAGAVGRPKVKNVRIVFSGQMREKSKDWFDFTSKQYNFFDEMERLFFMEARIQGLPTAGYHDYQDGQAGMRIKLLSLFPVVDLSGEELFKTETVTIFNDMCLFAPATLIDERIQWEPVDDTTARAFFTNEGVRIAATLHFNEKGQLVDFVSPDRSSVSGEYTGQFPFSTPMRDYRDFNGYNLTGYGEAVWHYPDGAFVYGKFEVREVIYNVMSDER